MWIFSLVRIRKTSCSPPPLFFVRSVVAVVVDSPNTFSLSPKACICHSHSSSLACNTSTPAPVLLLVLFPWARSRSNAFAIISSNHILFCQVWYEQWYWEVPDMSFEHLYKWNASYVISNATSADKRWYRGIEWLCAGSRSISEAKTKVSSGTSRNVLNVLKF